MNIDEYSQKLNSSDYENVYIDISMKSIALAKRVMETKEIEFDEEYYQKNNDLLWGISSTIRETSLTFRRFINLMNELQNWKDFDPESYNSKIQLLISIYNELENELLHYLEIQNQIDEHGFESLIDERKERLIKVFKEMLEYKNKAINVNWEFEDYILEVNKWYNVYRTSLYNVLNAIKYESVQIEADLAPIVPTLVDMIIFIDDLYNMLIADDGYKKYAFYYSDIELQEGEKYEDLYDREIEKLSNLFKEMLDYMQVNYLEDESYNDLYYKVMDVYPYYEGVLKNNYYEFEEDESYISLINKLRNGYNIMKKGYKNHDENLKKYIDFLQKEAESKNFEEF